MSINATKVIIIITLQIIFPTEKKILKPSDLLRFKKINRRIKPTRHIQVITKAIIYIANTPSLLNQRSAKPQIKKPIATKFAIKPVINMQFGLWSLKQQYNGTIPIFIFFIISYFY